MTSESLDTDLGLGLAGATVGVGAGLLPGAAEDVAAGVGDTGGSVEPGDGFTAGSCSGEEFS